MTHSESPPADVPSAADSTQSKPPSTGATPAGNRGNDPQAADGTGYGRLAKKIARRTTDLLAVSIIVIAGLTLGTRLSDWWNAEPPTLQNDSPAGVNVQWGAGGAPVLLEIGRMPYSVRREAIEGTREEVFRTLVERCGRIAAEVGQPPAEVRPAEARLLKLIQKQQPVLAEPESWEVYRIEQPLTLVFGVRCFQTAPSSDSDLDHNPASTPAASRSRGALGADTEHRRRENTDAEPGRRVVCWGMAYPSGERTWTLFTLQPVEEQREALPGLPRIDLPQGSRRILSLRDHTGGALIGFEGTGRVRECMDHFSVWFASHGWRPAGAWRSASGGRTARFVSAGDTPAGRVEVSLTPAGDGRWSGLISISPPPHANEELGNRE